MSRGASRQAFYAATPLVGVATFTSNSSWTAPATFLTGQMLLVGGGGGGGTNNNEYAGGGGGGGQVRLIDITADVTPGDTYTITVGPGGRRADVTGATTATNGVSSTAFGYTSIGGGYGGYNIGSNIDEYVDGGNGASGGGGPAGNFGTATNGGTGSAGYNGGTGIRILSPSSAAGGGGGGAGSAGTNGSAGVGGLGGAGVSYSISGSPVFYANGGGGAGSSSPTAGTRASGAGSGGGGGRGGATDTGTAGQAGTVIIQYTYTTT